MTKGLLRRARPLPLLALALGVAGLGLALGWVLVRLQVPIPAGLVVWAGFGAASLFALGAALQMVRGRTSMPTHLATPLGILGLVALLPACLVTPALSGYAANEMRIDAFADHILSHPLPEGARVLSLQAELGGFAGNGDRCDYKVTVWVGPRGPWGRPDVAEHFRGLAVRPAVPGTRRESVRVEVTTEPPGVEADAPTSVPTYAVTFLDAYGPNPDWRCW